jgi:hypothetical protein
VKAREQVCGDWKWFFRALGLEQQVMLCGQVGDNSGTCHVTHLFVTLRTWSLLAAGECCHQDQCARLWPRDVCTQRHQKGYVEGMFG